MLVKWGWLDDSNKFSAKTEPKLKTCLLDKLMLYKLTKKSEDWQNRNNFIYFILRFGANLLEEVDADAMDAVLQPDAITSVFVCLTRMEQRTILEKCGNPNSSDI